MSMSASDEKIIGNLEVDVDVDTEAFTSTTRAPGAVLRALLTYVFNPPPPLPLSRSLSQPKQRVYIASEIIPRIFISDIFTALNPSSLRSSRITHIISVIEYGVDFPILSLPDAESKSDVFSGSPSESNLLSQSPSESIAFPLTTLHVRLPDVPAADIFSHFSTTRDFITTALQDEDARVLVHCFKGRSRSPTIVAAYLISTFKVSASEALEAIKAKRPMVLPNHGFLRQLEQWEVVVREGNEMVCSDK